MANHLTTKILTPKMETIHEEFFKVDVDYYFEAPDQIISKRGRDKNKDSIV